MNKNYDYQTSSLRPVANPYTKRLKKQITIRLDADTIAYFKKLSEEKGIPYQSLVNLYLRQCTSEKRNLELKWL